MEFDVLVDAIQRQHAATAHGGTGVLAGPATVHEVAVIDAVLVYGKHRIVTLEGEPAVLIAVVSQPGENRRILAPLPTEVNAMVARATVGGIAIRDQGTAEGGWAVNGGDALHHGVAKHLVVAARVAATAAGVLDGLRVFI